MYSTSWSGSKKWKIYKRKFAFWFTSLHGDSAWWYHPGLSDSHGQGADHCLKASPALHKRIHDLIKHRQQASNILMIRSRSSGDASKQSRRNQSSHSLPWIPTRIFTSVGHSREDRHLQWSVFTLLHQPEYGYNYMLIETPNALTHAVVYTHALTLLVLALCTYHRGIRKHCTWGKWLT